MKERKNKRKADSKKEQVTRGHNIVVDGREWTSNPHPHPDPHPSHSNIGELQRLLSLIKCGVVRLSNIHTQIEFKNLFSSFRLDDHGLMDQWTNGPTDRRSGGQTDQWTKPLIELRVHKLKTKRTEI